MSEPPSPLAEPSVPDGTAEVPARPADWVTPPTVGEVITSVATGNSYTMGEKIGEGNFGLVYACVVWNNNLAGGWPRLTFCCGGWRSKTPPKQSLDGAPSGV